MKGAAMRTGLSRILRSRILRSSLALSLLASASGLAQAASPWTPFGPGDGSVLSLAVDPGNPAVVYAVAGVFANPGTLYKSTDGGDTWKALVGSRLHVVAIAPDQPATVYVAGDRLLRSRDGGQTWTELTFPATGEFHDVNSLVVLPGDVLLALDRSTLLRSADGGVSWSAVATVASVDTAYASPRILAAPADPSHVAYASRTEIHVSADGGLSFRLAARPPSEGTDPQDIAGFALSPSNPGTWYAMLGDNPTIFRSDDRGATWRVAGTLPISSPGGVAVLLVDPRTPDRVYAGTYFGLFKSVDGGRSWARSQAGLPSTYGSPSSILSLAAAPSQPGVLYAGLYEWGVARSRSAGERWQTGLETGLNASWVQVLKFPRPDTVLLALGRGARSFRSTDGGRTWQPFARGLSGQNGLTDIAWQPGHPETLYALNGIALWRSSNAGETWKRIATTRASRLAVLNPSTFVVNFDCDLFRTGDGGRTWRKVLRCEVADGAFGRTEELLVDPRNAKTLYAFTAVSNGSHFGYLAHRSRDGGLTWKRLQPALGFFTVAPSDFKILYAIDPLQARLLRSVDGGDHWNVVSSHLPDGIANPFAPMAVDAADPDTVYLGGLSSFHVSHDGGITFTPVDAPYEVEKRGARQLWTDRNRPGRVYATPDNGGLFAGNFR
jgi:photosystem II stability/assembly factor-like uncharacterized protein